MDTFVKIITVLLVLGVAAAHVYFLVLEMFLWTKPYGRRVFGMDKKEAEATKVLAANQGLYNGFLALGLVYGLVEQDPNISFAFLVFFLLCVIAAGCYGGWTVARRIAFVQAVPAAAALFFVVLRG